MARGARKLKLPCGHGFKSWAPADPRDKDARPSPGDVAVCFTCCTWHVYVDVDNNILRPFEADDFLRLTDDELKAIRIFTNLLKEFHEWERRINSKP